MLRRAGLGWAIAWCLTPLLLQAADKYELAEETTEQAQRVTVKIELDGQLQTPGAAGKAVALKLTGGGTLSYVERKLPGLLRDAGQFRGLRWYETPEITIQVAENQTVPELRPQVRLILAEGQTEGVRFSSPHGHLTYNELELLRAPVDSLTALALLPDDLVAVGDKWNTPPWALQFFTGTEAVEKSELTCELESVENDVARVKFQGEIRGGIYGASSEIKVEGVYQFDLKQKLLTSLTVSQSETRSVGAVSTGLKVTAKAELQRGLADTPAELDAASLEAASSEPDAKQLQLQVDAPEWALELLHERRWHLFHQGSNVVVLRMMDRGSLIAQCNVSPIGPAKAGEHVPEKQFQSDVQQAIGASFRKLESAEIVPSPEGLYIYRVVASGESMQLNAKKEVQLLPVQWMYFLLTHPDGRQIVLVFTIEKSLLERFGEADLKLSLGARFQTLKAIPEVKPGKEK